MVRHATTDVSPTRLALVRRAAIGFLRQIGNLLRALERRNDLKHLSELDDRFLKDIGLTRSDVQGALSQSLFAHAPVLVIRSAEREARAREATSFKPRPVVPVVKIAGRA